MQTYVDCNENSTTIQAIYTIVDALGMSKVIQDQEDVTSSFAIESVTNLTRVPYPVGPSHAPTLSLSLSLSHTHPLTRARSLVYRTLPVLSLEPFRTNTSPVTRRRS